jgi:site-specific recombinase XerD
MTFGRESRKKDVQNPLRSAETGFYLDREAMGCTKATMYWYHRYLGEIIEWLEGQGVTDPAAITANHVRSLMKYHQDIGHAPQTVHHYAACIKTFLNFCVADGIIAASPMVKVRMPMLAKKALPAFEVQDVRALLGACQTPRENAIVLVLLDSGVRIAEFTRLKVQDVDIAAGTVRVIQGKGRKDRTTFIGMKARKALHKYLATRQDLQPGDPLIAGEHGGGLGIRGEQKVLRELGERAGVKNCHPHTFRRTFALWSLRAGMNVHVLAKIMGHGDLETLRRYLALAESDLAEGHRLHGAVDATL